ncbi:sortase domain-containing protein [Streptomyces blattellae]|uniref:sortase domain-containing protein n=1 Tax=Streptomyces blattellae TaxID=2569855 RepID=UPI0012B6FC9C|nr:sortase [Streptomyces blattellae]
MARSRARPAFLVGVGIAVILGCSGGGDTTGEPTRAKETTSPATDSARPPSPSPSDPPAAPRTGTQRQDAWLTIEAIGLEDLRVVPYEGTTDDWPGTRIQNRGFGASPYGEQGGVGPGGVGNYLVTAHRLSAGGPLRLLPDLDEGERVVVISAGTRYEYEITDTRETSFRSARSLAEQRAAVPGDPGERPTQAMITISTCMTPEDNAAGNFWRDDRGNPEHRLDKIGVLTSTQPVQ